MNEELVRLGYAETFTVPPNVRYADRLRAAGRGIDPEPRAWPALPDGAIRADDAGQRVGETATVCDEVSDTFRSEHGRRPTFLRLGSRPYPDHKFTALIWDEDREAFGREPEDDLLGALVCVTGEIRRYAGRPEITLEKRAQLEPWE